MWAACALASPCPFPPLPITCPPLSAIPCTETCTDRLYLMPHRASTLPATAMAQQQLQFS